MFLARTRGQVSSRDVALGKVRGYPFGGPRTGDVHARRLRETIEDRTSRPTPIGILRGVGDRVTW